MNPLRSLPRHNTGDTCSARQRRPYLTRLGAQSAATVRQMISHIVDFGLNPQAAVEAARVIAFKNYPVMM
jgi:gamma-glutamyltranspeptidase